MRRLLFSLALAAMVLSACSDPATVDSSTPTDPGTPTTGATATTTLPDTGSTSAPGTTGTTSDRPVAPDFTLALGEGGTFHLADGAKPVYMVFWAEW